MISIQVATHHAGKHERMRHDDDDADGMWPSLRDLALLSKLGEPGDSGSVGDLGAVLFVRLYVCTTGDAMNTELYLRTATGEVYVA